jgi:death-on-curing protein
VTRFLSLAEFWFLAEHVTGIEAPTLIKAGRVRRQRSARRTMFIDLNDGQWV